MQSNNNFYDTTQFPYYTLLYYPFAWYSILSASAIDSISFSHTHTHTHRDHLIMHNYITYKTEIRSICFGIGMLLFVVSVVLHLNLPHPHKSKKKNNKWREKKKKLKMQFKRLVFPFFWYTCRFLWPLYLLPFCVSLLKFMPRLIYICSGFMTYPITIDI